MQTSQQSTAETYTRRELLSQLGGGFGGLALASMLAAAETTDSSKSPLASKRPQFPPRAKRIVQLFCPGGLSQVDSWDYKPVLEKRAGQPFDPSGQVQFFASKPGNCQPSFWKFRQHGQSGLWMSDLFPKLAGHVDKMAFVYSMVSKTALHGPACFMANTGFMTAGFPSMGAWVTYGLGCETENLPAFVVLPDVRGLPPGGIINWGAGFLPAVYQGTTLNTDPAREPIADLFPSKQSGLTRESDRQVRDFMQSLNAKHRETRRENSDLEARISSYELAARLQLSAPEALDFSDETAATHELYRVAHEDIGPFGRQCLLARRLLERGVRFVQIYCGSENTSAKKIRPNWDSHEDLPRDHGYWGAILDTGASALLTDLEQRGLLHDTLVICTTEFGRQPGAQGGKGRDHNAGAFTAWMAGGGIKGGVGYGATDELGFVAAEKPTYCYDLHATALHLLGLNHEQLSFYNNGIARRLTDVHGHVLSELLA